MMKMKMYFYEITIMFFLITVSFSLLPVYASDPPVEVKKSDSAVQITATVENAQFNEVREKIIAVVRSGKVPSVSVAVAQGGKIIWEESFGWADREKMIPATPHTMYSLASISKSLTATGLMILVERGLVKLDEPVNTYIAPAQLTAYEGNTSDVTVKHLLNHTAGLPIHYVFFYGDESYSKPDITESIRRYGILVHPPGEIYQYSNFGFGILGHIISKVSGKSLANFMKNEVFLPLGMTRSSLNIGPGFEEYAATRYDPDNNNPIPFYDFDHPGASAFYCSAHDLVRFGMFHLKDHLPDQTPIIGDKTIDEMHHEKNEKAANWTKKTKRGYALGWSINEDDYGYRTVSHHGGMPGVATKLNLIPLEDIAVVVLSNCSVDEIWGLFNDIESAMLPEFKKNLEKSREQKEPEPEPFKPVPEMLGTWEGEIKTYEGVIPITMEFQNDCDVHVVLKSEIAGVSFLETLLNDVAYEDGFLTGRFYGRILTGDAMRHPHEIVVKMKMKGKRLVGYAIAKSTTKRVYWGLPSSISLTKK